MKKLATALALTLGIAAAAACSDDTTTTVTPGGGTSSGDAGASSSGASSSGSTGDDDDTTGDDDDDTTQECTAAKKNDVGVIDKVSDGAVTKTGENLFVNAAAGGSSVSKNNPRVYLDLATQKRVDITDVEAETSTAWDLALKRSVLFTNSGDGGKGQGGSKFLANKAFGDVTAADAADLATESFFGADCAVKKDPFGAVETSFSGWYDYDEANNVLTPFEGTWVVKGGTGKLYRVQILSFYANDDATPSDPVDKNKSGNYAIKIAPLE